MNVIDVLVAEDDESVRILLCDVMRDEGYAVRAAQNGREALEECRRHVPDLLLLDLRMPVLDGVETAKEIDSSGWRWFPIIVVTGDFNAPAEISPRVTSVLRKPVDLYELVHATKAALTVTPTTRPT